MARVIFPIGRYLGATVDGDHEVCRGGLTERLDATSFAAWGLGHGPADPVLAAGVPWTRAELVRYAGLAGLIEQALLTEAPASGKAALAFARTHRVVPIAVGLGNTAEAPARFTIGFFDRALVQVDELRYDVWCWSTVYDTLWQVCQARAEAARGNGRSEPAGAPDRTDPAGVLSHFLTGTHQLASANALYLDAVDQ